MNIFLAMISNKHLQLVASEANGIIFPAWSAMSVIKSVTTNYMITTWHLLVYLISCGGWDYVDIFKTKYHSNEKHWIDHEYTERHIHGRIIEQTHGLYTDTTHNT